MMYKPLIIEGMDGTGKSSLIEQLSPYLLLNDASEVHRESIEPPYLVEFTLSQLDRWHDSFYPSYKPLGPQFELLVYDRFPLISEEIYGKVLRGVNCFGPNYGYLFQQMLKAEPIFIYCRPPKAEIFKNLSKSSDEQLEGVLPNDIELLRRYDSLFMELMVQGHYSIMIYNYKSQNIQEVERWITTIIS